MTVWAHHRLDISSNAVAVGNSANASFTHDDTILIAKILISASTEYHCSWSLTQAYEGVSIGASMVAENSIRNMLGWKTSGGVPPGHGSLFVFEWSPGLVLGDEYKISLICVQEATAGGSMIGTAHILYTEI